MGKRKKKNENNDENGEINNNEIFELSSLDNIISIVNSNDNEKIEQLSLFLSSFDIDEIDNENVYLNLTSDNFLLNYINLLIKQNISIENKNNIVVSLLNIFILCGEDNKLKSINYNNLLKNSLLNVFTFYYSNISSNIQELENENYVDFILNLSDLLILLIEILSKDEYIKGKFQIFDNIIGIMINIIFNNDFQKNKIKNTLLNIIYNLTSSFYIEINEINQLNKLKLLQIEDSNYICALFYIYCANRNNNLEIDVQKLIDIIYNNVNNSENFSSNIIKFKEFLDKYLKDETIENSSSIKGQIQDLYCIVNQYYIYIKTLNDIYENISDDKNNINVNSSNLLYSDIISITVSSFFTKDIIKKSLNDNFLSNIISLIQVIQTNKIDSFILKDSNKLLKIIQNISQIEIFALNNPFFWNKFFFIILLTIYK